MADEILLAARVRELLHYDPLTGIFTRRVRTAQRHQVGDRADFLIKSGHQAGYYRVSFDSKRYLAHRVAWLYVLGVWPSDDIDHRDTDRGNNRIDNLRDVGGQMNSENIRRPRAGKCGLLGVHAHQGRWRARLQVNKRSIDLGCFDTQEEAHQAYVEGKRKHHKGCTL